MRQTSRLDLTFAGLCVALSLITGWLNWQSPVARTLLEGKRISGLIIGSDYEDRTRHSDTLMYVSYDPQSRFLDVLSIPRDTHVTFSDLPSVHRINEIFAYEFHHTGKDFNLTSLALKNRVEILLSSGAAQAMQIPYYFTIDYNSFRAIIDAMGGIYVNVTEPMNYDDNWGHLHIHLEPGLHLMDGHTSLLYVRYRGANADQGRVLRQQIFVKDVLKRLKNPMLFWSLPKYARVVLDGVHTNFSVWDLLRPLMEGTHMQWKNLRLFAVPGNVYGNLWKMNVAKTQEILALMQAPVQRNRPKLLERSRAALESRNVATVEIWNASSHANVARNVVQVLRDKGFDVVQFGNFATRQQRTLVIDRSGRLRPAQEVAEALHLINPEVVSRVDLGRQVDVSVILGNDASVMDTKKAAWQ